MAPTNDDLRVAIAAYWKGKSDQRAAAEAISSTAEGTSKAVRGGAHFAPVVSLLARFFTDAGYPDSSIGVGQGDGRTILPGYYRPTKAWDLVVVHKNVLVAAIELKCRATPLLGTLAPPRSGTHGHGKTLTRP